MELVKSKNNQNSKNRKYTIFFTILLILFIAIRLFGINQPIVDDETNFVQYVNDPGAYYIENSFSIHPHPPLGGWSYLLFGNIFGFEVWAYRLVPLLLWVINLTLVFLIVRNEYSARAALFSSLIMGLSYYSNLISLQMGIEGSFLTTSFLLMAWFYLKYIKNKNKSYLFWSGISFGIGLWTKISAVFFIFVLVLHRFIILKSKKRPLLSCFKKVFLETSLIVIVGGLFFAIFPILMPTSFSQTLGNGASYYGLNISWMAISMLLFWATPLLLGLFLFQALKFKLKDSLWIIWFVIIFSIYTFLIVGRLGTHDAIGGVADYSRHFMNLLVPLSVMGGVFLSKIKINKKQIYLGTIVLISFLISFFVINFNTSQFLPRNFSIYLNAIKEMSLNFFFSYTTSSGNLTAINMGIIIFSIFFLTLLAIIYLLLQSQKKLAFSKWILVIFISAGVALNIFLVAEYLGPVTSPDIKNSFYEMVNYGQDNFLGPEIYTTDEGLLLHYNNLQFEQAENQFWFGPNLEFIPNEDLKGTVLYFNWPPKVENEQLNNLLQKCTLKKKFSSQRMIIGKAYHCH